jgi:hypothetical protein
MKHDMGKLVFKDTADKILARLEIDTSRQRLDSTHILSNIAVLTRLGLFCETIRVFLRDARKHAPSEFEKIPSSLRSRYLKDDGESSSYEDAKPTKVRRRLEVCARDVWRLLDRGKGCKEISQLETYALLKRLLDEQCELARRKSTHQTKRTTIMVSRQQRLLSKRKRMCLPTPCRHPMTLIPPTAATRARGTRCRSWRPAITKTSLKS